MNIRVKLMGQPQEQEEPYAIEIAVNQAIGACEGDLRATIRALIIANTLLEEEIAELIDVWCSSGFHRGKLRVRDLPWLLAGVLRYAGSSPQSPPIYAGRTHYSVMTVTARSVHALTLAYRQ
jgi:hypothetical protein